MSIFNRNIEDSNLDSEIDDQFDDQSDENQDENKMRPFDRIFKPYNLKNGNIRILLVVALLFYIVLLCYSLSNQINQYNYSEKQAKDYQFKATQIKYDLENNLDASNERYAASMLKLILTTSDISFFTNNLWDYRLYLGNTRIKDTNTLTMPADGKLSLNVIHKKSTLPTSLINQGSLTGGDPYDNVVNYISLKGENHEVVKSTIKEGGQSIFILQILRLKKATLFQLVFQTSLLKDWDLLIRK